MKVQSIEIKNFKCIKEVSQSVNGHNIIVTAGNQKGKTSFIDAIRCQMPPEALKQGTAKGHVKIDMGDYIAVFDLKNGKNTLTLLTEHGEVLNAPATTLKTLLGKNTFDIDKFLEQSNNERIKLLKEISGINTDDIESQIKHLSEELILANRDLKKDKAIYDQLNYNPEATKEKPVDTLKDELEQLQQAKVKNVGIKSRLDARKVAIAKNNDEIKELKAKIEKLISENEDMQAQNEQATMFLEDNEVHEFDIEVVKRQIENAEHHNTEVKETLEALEKRQNIEILESQIKEMKHSKKLKQEKLNAMLKFPIEKLYLSDNQLMYDGLPFEKDQINTAERIIVGLQIQLALCGQVKIAAFDGSLLDDENLKRVESWAEANDLQLVIEIVDRKGSELTINVIE